MFNRIYFQWIKSLLPFPPVIYRNNRWPWLAQIYSMAVELANAKAGTTPYQNLSTPVDRLKCYCDTFSQPIVWPAGREPHKSLPSLSHRKSSKATPSWNFPTRLHGTIKSCHEWESKVNTCKRCIFCFSASSCPKYETIMWATSTLKHRKQMPLTVPEICGGSRWVSFWLEQVSVLA